MPLRVKTARDEAQQATPVRGNNYVLIIFDSCRYDSLVEARPRTICKLGTLEQRWSYASWTAPSHYNLLSGLLPHHSPKQVFASDYYKKDLLQVVGGKLKENGNGNLFFSRAKCRMLRDRQVKAIQYLDRVVEELFDIVPKNTYVTITADHGELFGEDGYFGHGPIQHEKVLEVPFVEGKLR